MLSFVYKLYGNTYRATAVRREADKSHWVVEFEIPWADVQGIDALIEMSGSSVFDVVFEKDGGVTMATYSGWRKLN